MNRPGSLLRWENSSSPAGNWNALWRGIWRMQINRGKLDLPLAASRGESDDEGFCFPISPFMIFPEAYGEFAVYVRKGKNLILFTRQGGQFTKAHKAILHENGIREVYIQSSQKPEYDRYLEEHLGTILPDESIPLAVRSSVVYHQATSILGVNLRIQSARPEFRRTGQTEKHCEIELPVPLHRRRVQGHGARPVSRLRSPYTLGKRLHLCRSHSGFMENAGGRRSQDGTGGTPA